MNEIEVEKMLSTYRDSIGNCTIPTLEPRRVFRRNLLVCSAAAIVTISVLGVSLWPRDAAAGTLRQMRDAIQNAHSMEVTEEVGHPGADLHPLVDIKYRDGMWHYDAYKSAAMTVSCVVKDGQVLTSYRSLPHAVLRRRNDEIDEINNFSKGSALEFAEKYIDYGLANPKRQLHVQAHDPVDGEPTYLIVFDRSEDSYHAEIVVNQRTNLPIYSEATVVYAATSLTPARTQHLVQRYRFNQPINDAEFSFHPNKPVVMLETARPKLLQKWSYPVASFGSVDVASASVTPDGTVWIASASPRSAALPSQLTDDRGRTYVREADVNVDNGLPETSGPLKIGGKDLDLVAFVPLQPGGSLPREAVVQFARREAGYRTTIPPREENPLVGKPLAVGLRQEAETLPSYFPALDLDRFGFEVGVSAWRTRAQAYEGLKDLLNAAQSYERAAKEYQNFIPYGAYRPLDQAARCYRLMGRAIDAERVERESEAAKALRP